MTTNAACSIRIGLAQVNPTVGDLEGNLRLIEIAYRRALEFACDIVLFPELALTGYPPEDLLLSPGFIDAAHGELERLAALVTRGAVVVGTPWREEGRLLNAAVVLADGRVAAVYGKRELPNYGVFDEQRHFSPGSAPLLVECAGLVGSVTVCEDLWIAGGAVERDLCETRPDFILNLSASPFHAGKDDERLGVLSRIATLSGGAIAYVNIVGGQDELVFDGGSLLMAGAGHVTARAARFEEDLLVVECPPSNSSSTASAARDLLHLDRISAGGTDPPAVPERLGEAPSEILSALILGTRDYVRKNGFDRVVLGLSGGIDSALVAAIATEALGPEKVTGVTMPSRHSSKETLADAHLLARNLGIECLEIPIDGLYQRWLDELAGPLQYGTPGVEAENLQARIRGTIIMTLSNRFGSLALTTGNKSETAMGYCTLYGDMAGGFAVLKDVFKGTVYELAHQINRRAGRSGHPWPPAALPPSVGVGRAVIPETTIRRAPSAELRPNQKDEDSLPPYPVLDPILREYVENDRSAAEIARLLSIEEALVRDVIRTVDRNEYKRRQAPPGIRITPRAFGRDRRMPITNRWSR